MLLDRNLSQRLFANAVNPLEMFATMSALNFIITSGDKVKLMYSV